MLILTRRIGETLMIGDDVTITVLRVNGNQVRMGINAPKTVAVHREEIYAKVKREFPMNQIIATSDKFRAVPCNGCKRCCIDNAIRILPHEDVARWKTEPNPYFPGHRMLAHKHNGECWYLGEHGCTIHGQAPQQCLQFDCRIMAKNFTYTQIKKVGKKTRARVITTWQKGKELLREENEGRR